MINNYRSGDQVSLLRDMPEFNMEAGTTGGISRVFEDFVLVIVTKLSGITHLELLEEDFILTNRK